MPYVDLHSSDDYASIYYITNTPRGNVGGFRPDRPSIILLHPVFLDSTWLHHQFGDPRLSSNYNIIAFDTRLCGRSEARSAARHDSWVEAADLAFCHQALHLPPCHIMALEGLSIHCALRFAVLFPEMCLSLTLCNVPAPTEMNWIVTAYDELTKTWRYAEDLDSFEHVAKEAAQFVIGSTCDPDLMDELIAYWEVVMPPVRGLRTVEITNVFVTRKPLRPDVLASITQPVLIIHGEHNPTCPKVHAETLSAQLVNSKGGAVLYTIKGGSGTLSVVPGMASLVNKVFTSFLSRLPFVGSELVSRTDRVERMKTALAALSDITGDSSILMKDPLSSLSFCCSTDEEIQRQSRALQEYRLNLWNAFSPTGPDGRPFRRYSDRKNDQWFDVGEDGVSVAGTGSHNPAQERARENDRERLERLEKSLLSQELNHELRPKRGNNHSASGEKSGGKSSAAKTVKTAATHAQRIIF